jgi:hypothetical protein
MEKLNINLYQLTVSRSFRDVKEHLIIELYRKEEETGSFSSHSQARIRSWLILFSTLSSSFLTSTFHQRNQKLSLFLSCHQNPAVRTEPAPSLAYIVNLVPNDGSFAADSSSSGVFGMLLL